MILLSSKRGSDQFLCFEVENYEEVSAADPSAIQKLEEALARAGALPTRIDFPERVLCVKLQRPDLSHEEIIQVVAQIGFRTRLKGV